MFQFPGFACLATYHIFNMVGCPIRIPADQFVCANPRSFSQLITSFFASESLGIPHTPLFCLLYFLLFNEFDSKIWYARSIPLHYYFSRILCFQYVNELSGSPYLPGPDNGQLMEDNGCCPWWRISESNRWPPACKAGALASWANPPFVSVVGYQLTVIS